MNLDDIISRLERNIETFRGLFNGISNEQALWRPEPGKWSMLEVVNHLYDEDREDFRARIDYLLHQEGGTPPPTDPQGWVTAREYQKRDYKESVENFFAERRRSIEWLGTIQSPDWERAYIRDGVPIVNAGSILISWPAHDYLHIRQITMLHYGYMKATVAPYDIGYAG